MSPRDGFTPRPCVARLAGLGVGLLCVGVIGASVTQVSLTGVGVRKPVTWAWA